jgi:hypothetical protein
MSAGPLQSGFLNGVLIGAHPLARNETGDRDFPGWSKIKYRRSIFPTIWNWPNPESSVVALGAVDMSNTPPRTVYGPEYGIGPGIRGVVERSGVNDRPAHEVGSRVVSVLVSVEDIANISTVNTRSRAHSIA